MLAKDSTLRIVSRTSVMQYKGAHSSLAAVARALGADAVLEGSFSRPGSRNHVNLQLIRADNDSHMWAESYDRDPNDGSIPLEAAQAIVKRLGGDFRAPAPLRFISPEAHDAYLRGQYLWPTGHLDEAGAYFKKATLVQPDYAEAWAGLANYYGAGIAGGSLDPRSNIRLEEEAADRALALAPDLALAHQAEAASYLIDRWDWADADREILLSIHLDPNDSRSYYLQGCVLAAMNRMPEAIQAETKFMALNPYENPSALAYMDLEARRYDDALAEIKLRSEAAPNDAGLLFTEKEVWRRKGNWDKAVDASASFHLAIGEPKSAVELRQAYATGGMQGFVRWELQQRLAQAKQHYVSPVELASYSAQLGENERALSLLEEGYRQHSTEIIWIAEDPAYDGLHASARYKVLIQKLGHSAR